MVRTSWKTHRAEPPHIREDQAAENGEKQGLSIKGLTQ